MKTNTLACKLGFLTKLFKAFSCQLKVIHYYITTFQSHHLEELNLNLIYPDKEIS